MRDKINGLMKKFYTDEPNKLEWGLAIFACAVIFINLFYGDNVTMFLGYFWNNMGIFNMGSLEWLGNNRLPYGIVQQFMGQIWCLPVNVWYKLWGMNEIANTWVVWWFKICVLIFFMLSLKEMMNIADKIGIGKKNQKWMIYTFVTSVLVALPVFHVAQCDAIYMFFMLKGISAYLDEDNKKFLIYFMLAIDCKYMAIFMFIPLVLLREKRILFIIRDCIVGVVLVPLQLVWYKIVRILDTFRASLQTSISENSTMTATDVPVTHTMAESADRLDSEYTGFMSHFYHKTLYFDIPAIRKEYVASVLVVLFVLLCIWCFARKKDAEKRIDDMLYVGFVSMTLLFAMSSPNPYWIVTMYPMTFLMMYRNPRRIRLNLILQIGYSMTMFLVYLDSMEFVYGGTENFMHMPLTDWFHIVPHHDFETGPTVYGYLAKLGIPSLMPVIVAICLACLIAWFIINYPRIAVNIEDNESEENVLKFQHGVAVFQSLFLIIWFALCVYCLSRY